MDPGSAAIIAYGVLGGFISEFLHLYQFRQTAFAKLPRYLKSPFYWVMTLGMIGVGGLLPFLYVSWGWAINGFLAVQIGSSAPLIIGKLVSKEPKIE